jgi:hypothetical protein
MKKKILKSPINYLNHKIEEIQETGSVIGVDKDNNYGST